MASFLINEMIATLRGQKQLAEKAIVQLTDDHIRTALDVQTNSIAVIIKHMAGNMVSRWTDFLTTDGEKPDRDRDSEFVDSFTSRAEIMQRWEAGWQCLFNTMQSLCDDDLSRQVATRAEQSSVAFAILRQISHYGYHVGQIVLIARILAKDQWQTITIPRGQSRQFNERMLREKSP